MGSKKVIFFANECKNVNSACAPYELTLGPGYYLLEVWGAQGGNSTIHNTGYDLPYIMELAEKEDIPEAFSDSFLARKPSYTLARRGLSSKSLTPTIKDHLAAVETSL